jgi:hypothetical protein
VEATAEHPFWLEGRGWVGAGSLRAGERVLRADGRWLRVERVEAREGRRTVYNLEVEGWHTYVVGELGAWVHNACGKETAKRALEAADLGLDEAKAIVQGTFGVKGGKATAYIKYLGEAQPGAGIGRGLLEAKNNLKSLARSEGAGSLRIETTRVIEESGRLERVLQRAGFQTRPNGTMWFEEVFLWLTLRGRPTVFFEQRRFLQGRFGRASPATSPSRMVRGRRGGVSGSSNDTGALSACSRTTNLRHGMLL